MLTHVGAQWQPGFHDLPFTDKLTLMPRNPSLDVILRGASSALLMSLPLCRGGLLM
jgi:hypothetical protein